jgi:hypothetical protein
MVGFHPSKKYDPYIKDKPLLYDCLDALENQTRRDLIDEIYVVQNNIKGVKGMIKSRNRMRDFASNLGMDLLNVDSDTILPPDAIEKLISVPEEYAVVGGLYKTNRIDYATFSRLTDNEGQPLDFYVNPKIGQRGIPFTYVTVPNDDYDWHPVGGTGAGCCLYRIPFLNNVEFTTTWKGVTFSKADDQIVCLHAQDKGLKIASHFGVRCEHRR